MEAYKFIFLTLLVCNVVAILVGTCRALLCVARTPRARRPKLILLPVLGILLVLGIVGVNAVIWLAYGVAHSGKQLSTELVLVACTCGTVFAGVYGLWKLSLYAERQL